MVRAVLVDCADTGRISRLLGLPRLKELGVDDRSAARKGVGTQMVEGETSQSASSVSTHKIPAGTMTYGTPT
ncbi:hypothetical protein B4U45_26200 [Mycobacterium persicum]|jgi:hypothetical protein|uniref:Uncharacterized protein n=2 Tax=Mycobacterium TaxID=1763 RepID=A0A1X0LF50_9MYCO|nr:hypothetical protein B1T45_08430 [Mycobacterium kansasii]ARV82771.1 hypothetical protein BWK49_16855 [Mycobacterium intracellulare subsp. chimaera]KQH80753.1 hypothetical protein AO501_22100 [Mycobacterium gordonae]KZS84988.1 hypothetical protein A4G31_24950 [Mycobacterium persicum]BBZ83678.1 hypothetical protein MABM_35940 [Mycobacteroides abscessus]